MLENQLPATTVNVSIRAYTRWFTSDYASPLETIVSDSRSEPRCYHVINMCTDDVYTVYGDCDMESCNVPYLLPFSTKSDSAE